MMSILRYQGIPIWRHARAIQWAAQIVSGFLVVFFVVWFFINIYSAIHDRNIPFGFNFLDRSYQTPIGQTFIPYDKSDSFLYALGVAITNTVVVSIVGVILATLLGIVVGVARLSSNWLVAKIATVYIEFFRNVPLLVQLFFWFYIALALPRVRDGYVLMDAFYINNAGMSMPWPTPPHLGAGLIWLAVAVVSIVMGVIIYRIMAKRELLTGRASYPVVYGSVVAVAVGALAWIIIMVANGQAPFTVSFPAPEGRFGRIGGGFTAPAGLLVLLIGLVTYTASFIAEIVRAGIQSVGRGQTEAARSLGLSQMETLRQVTFPQALRVIIPPLISQFLNLTKNSSLAGAIGYADLTNVAKTMTQTAPAVSIYIIIMLAYLAMSLTYSLIGNLYNRHIRFVGG